MADFISAIGGGIAGLVTGALLGIGAALRGIVATADATLPGGMLAVVVFVALMIGAFALAKR